jgi:hypothetical protein
MLIVLRLQTTYTGVNASFTPIITTSTAYKSMYSPTAAHMIDFTARGPGNIILRRGAADTAIAKFFHLLLNLHSAILS